MESRLIDLCVTVTVDPNYPESIDAFEIDWGDGTEVVKRAGQNTSFNLEHRYNFTDFFESCAYESPSRLVSLRTYVNGDTRPIQSLFPLTALNPPKAEFGTFPATVCVNELISFPDKSCPVSDLEETWDFGDGSATSEFGVHTYTATGTYRVKLFIENDCGTDEVSREIRVIDQPIAVALPDSGIVAGFDAPYRVCLDRSSTIRVDSRASVGLNSRAYTVSPSTGVRITDGGKGLSRITFTEPGRYEVLLSGKNDNCATQASAGFTVEVLESTVLQLDPQPDVCTSFSYCPTPAVSGATYTLNGQPLTGCTETLGEGTYVVEAFLENEICGDATLRDTFVISPQATAQIAQSDTTICDQDGPLSLTASPPGGSWTVDGQPFDGTLLPASLSPGIHRIRYGSEPCLVSDEISVEIIGSEVTVPGDTDLCLDGGPTTFRATPAGGTFSGSVVDPDGTFDPAEAGIGSYTITYTWEDGDLAGCGSSASFRVNVSELAVDFLTLSCSGNEVCLAVDSSAVYESVRWNFGDGGTGSGGEVCHTFGAAGTYQVSVTATQGPCEVTTTRQVSIAPAPVAAFTLDYPSDRCSDLPVTITNTSRGSDLTYVWRLNGEIFAEDAAPASPLLTSRTRDTTYEISLEVTNGCISNTISETIVVRPLPTADFGTDQDLYCSGDTIRLANNAIGQPTSYAWKLDGKVIGTDSLPPFVVHETEVRDTLELCLTTRNACGESNRCRPLIVTPTDVTAFFNVSPTVICVDDTVRLTNFATPGVAVSYDFGNGNGSTSPNATVVYRTAGTYVIRQRAYGCGSDVVEKTVTVLERPTARFDVPAVSCAGSEVTFTNLSGDNLRASWDFGDGSGPVTDESPSHTFDSAGVYQVCLTVTSLGPDGCDHTVCGEVTVSPRPVTGFSFPDSTCLGAELRVASTAAGANLSYRYRFGDGAIATDGSPVHTYQQAGSYRITQVVTDGMGCTDSTSATAFVRAVPTADFLPVREEVCAPDSIAFQNLSTDATGFRWDFGDGGTSSLEEPVYAYTATGEFRVTLTATDLFCTNTSSRTITVRQTPTAAIALPDTAVCFGESLAFRDATTGTVDERRWTFGDGEVGYAGDEPHTYAAPGSYVATLFVAGPGGCADSTRRGVIVHAPATGDLLQTEDIRCNGEATATLEVTTATGREPFSYGWSDGGVGFQNASLAAGAYTVTVTDANGCRFTDSVRVTEPAVVEPRVEVNTVTCFGGSDGSLRLNVAGGTSPFRLSWAGGETDSLLTELPAGDYAVTIVDGADCAADFTFTVPENPAIVVEENITEISCFGQRDGVLELASVTGGVSPYVVTLTGDDYQRSGTTVSRFDELSPGIYTLEVVDKEGCFEERTLELVEPDRVELNILQDSIQLGLGDTVRLATRYNAFAPVFRWTPANGLDCIDCPEPLARPFVSQRYVAEIIDGRGCTARDTVFVGVEVTRDVYIPNTFTPNGDGRNDIFRVRTEFPAAIAQVVSFQVWDRWGVLLHEAYEFPPEELAFGWDGTFKGRQVNTGQYVYQALVRFVDGFEKKISGSILILR